MAEIWGAAIAAVGAVGGAYLNSKNASKNTSSSGTSGFCSCVQAGTKQSIQTAEQIANQPFQAYCVNNAVAGLTCNQLAAQAAAGNNAQYLPAFQQTAAQQFNPQTIQQYSNPYVKNVLDAQNAMASQTYQTEQAALNAKQGMTSAFGGDRSAIANNALTTNYNLMTNANNATGLSNAYNSGVSAFQADRNYAAGQSSQIEGALASTGAVAQATNQNRANFNYNQFCQQRNWQKNQNAYLTQTLAQVPKGQYYTGNQTSTTIPAGGGWGGALAGAATIASKGLGGGGGTTAASTTSANEGLCNGASNPTQYCTAASQANVLCTASAGGAFGGPSLPMCG